MFSDNVTRPILIVGPLSEAVLDKLLSDYPDKFARCEPEYMNCDQEALEKVGIGTCIKNTFHFYTATSK